MRRHEGLFKFTTTGTKKRAAKGGSEEFNREASNSMDRAILDDSGKSGQFD